MKRVLTSLLLVPFALYSVFVAPPLVFAAIVALMASLCYYEYMGIARASGVQGPLSIGFAAGFVVLALPESLPLLVPAIVAASIVLGDLRKSLAFAAATLLGVLYIFLAWRSALPLRESSSYWILFALAINWVGDIAAFYIGRAIGKHKLALKISPGKSWEGAIASTAASVLFGIWYGYQLSLLPVLPMAVLSAAANIAGQVGDLAESALKRGAGLKDSGNLLPGHGGFLDRLDSTLFTLPVVYGYLFWIVPLWR